LALEDLQRVLLHNRADLTDVEQTVVGARFAVVGHDRVQTLQEVGGLLKLSKERVRQVQTGALTKVRLALELAASPAMTSPGKTNGAFETPTTTIPGRLAPGVLAAAERGT
jgi:hypothetical protein